MLTGLAGDELCDNALCARPQRSHVLADHIAGDGSSGVVGVVDGCRGGAEGVWTSAAVEERGRAAKDKGTECEAD